MAKEEIIGGLKNAVERGESIDKAVQSFINAGYNANEVREAANLVTSGVATQILTQSSEKSEAKESQLGPVPKKSSSGRMIFIIILVIILLLIGTSITAMVFFPDLLKYLPF